MPDKRLAFLVFAWLILASTEVLAQERQQVSLGSDALPVTVFADRIENLDRDRLLVAEGRVEIEQGDVRLEADRVEVNTETGEAVAAGKVVFFDGRDRLNGDRLEYNFKTATGIVFRADGRAEPHFFFKGDRMERFGDKAYRLFQGVFTTCEDETPAWSVHWGKATAYLDDYIWGTNASFWVWKIPVVPFIPVFGASLRKDRETGLLTPTFGTSQTKGFFVKQPIFFALSDSQDLTVAPTYFEKRGPGLLADYRYVRTETSRGEISGFYLDDSKATDENRYVVSLRHEEQIAPGLVLKVDLAHVSDNTFLSEFGDTLDQRSAILLESNIFLTQRWEKWNFFARLFTYQDLTTTVPVELQRLPEIRLTAFSQPTPGLPGLLYQLDSSYNNFVRDVGSAGQRLDFHPQFAYPISPGGFFTLTPRLGIRETLYDTKVVGTIVDQGFTVEDTRNEFVARSLFEAGADLEARAYRVFDLDGALGIARLQHVIEPRVTYGYLAGSNNNDLPRWDGIDAITPNHGVTYSLTNRFKARAVDEGGQPGRVWEVARLTLSQAYAIDPVQATTLTTTTNPITGTTTTSPTTSEPQRLSDLSIDLILEPLYGIRFRGTALIDPYQMTLTSLTTDASYEAKNWRVSFGTRNGQNGDLQFIQGTADAKLGTHWAVRFSSNYDVQSSTVVENRVEVDFREQCWGITAAYVNRPNDNEFRVTVNLLELGQYGFGRAFAAFP